MKVELTRSRIVTLLTRNIDLNTLSHLSLTCRQIRMNLLQFRSQLISQTLRCENEDLDLNSDNVLRYRARAADWYFTEDGGAGNGKEGKAGYCAKDLVGECRRCGKVVCRVCLLCLTPIPLSLLYPKPHPSNTHQSTADNPTELLHQTPCPLPPPAPAPPPLPHLHQSPPHIPHIHRSIIALPHPTPPAPLTRPTRTLHLLLRILHLPLPAVRPLPALRRQHLRVHLALAHTLRACARRSRNRDQRGESQFRVWARRGMQCCADRRGGEGLRG
jgi:hypothetical protein